MHSALRKFNFRIAVGIQLQVEVFFAVFGGEDAAAAGQIAVGQCDGFAFCGSAAGRDRIGVGDQFQFATDDHRLHDAVLHRDMVHFVAVHFVAWRAEAGVASTIPTGVDVARRLDNWFGLEAVLVRCDQREVALDAMRLQDALDDFFGLRVGVDGAPQHGMAFLKNHIIKMLCKFSDHFSETTDYTEYYINQTNHASKNVRLKGEIMQNFYGVPQRV